MALNGYIKLHRKMLNWGWYDDPVVKILWLHLLLSANFKETTWGNLTLKPGQVVTGSNKLAVILGISRQQVRTGLRKLQETNEITMRTTKRYTLITIVKWEDYQLDEEDATNTTTINPPSKQPTDNPPSTIHQPQRKNVKNNNIYCPFFVSFWDSYPRKVGKPKAALAFKNLMVDDQLLQTMLAALEKQKKSRQWQDTQYIPYPATWLNQSRWEDELAEPDDTEQRYKFRN